MMHGRDGSGRSNDRGGKSEEPLLVFGNGPDRVGRNVGVLGLCGQVPVPAFLREGSRVQNVPARPSGPSRCSLESRQCQINGGNQGGDGRPEAGLPETSKRRSGLQGRKAPSALLDLPAVHPPAQTSGSQGG